MKILDRVGVAGSIERMVKNVLKLIEMIVIAKRGALAVVKVKK